MTNLLATLGEDPLIRYYQPHHHPPLGPLSLAATMGTTHSAAAPQSTLAAPSAGPSGASQRLKSAMGARTPQTFGGEQIPRRLALQIQSDMDDYKALNPEFPVSGEIRAWTFVFTPAAV